MHDSKSFGRTAAVLGALLVGLFFLPWVSFRCDADAAADYVEKRMGQSIPDDQIPDSKELEFFSASGWQLAMGEATINTDSEKFQQSRRQSGMSEAAFEEEVSKANGELAEKLPARPWFFAALAAGVIMLIVGGMVTVESLAPEVGGKLVMLCGLVGVGLALTAFFGVDFYADIESEVQYDPGMAVDLDPSDFLVTGGRYGLWITLLLNVAAFAVGATAKPDFKPHAAGSATAGGQSSGYVPAQRPSFGARPAPTRRPSFRPGLSAPAAPAESGQAANTPQPDDDPDDISSFGPSL